ncbi:FtsX-like permease family protein [Saccharothrix texasensis]|uniref:Putative ABC transport system permease protein n=1 Tax=Saccharothrix texasensis TaxID=103734 RepID=A0A3N1GYG6_9PSEU|nr:FtsX-like permease family protein [Saccharothrix texasensis]ROP35072.1 putative ABC transport system permease protein [Saccharothrix texasensis]
MLKLALRLVSHHRTTAVATGLIALVGMALVVAMTTILATGLADRTAAADRAFLTQFPLIMGGWVVAIVVFAMVSTISVTLDGRAEEISGLRLIGAGPRQVRVLVSAETLAISAAAAPPGLGLGYLLGWLLFQGVRGTGLTEAGTVYSPGIVLPVVGVVVVLGAGVPAAWIGSRKAAERSPVETGAPSRPGSSRVARRRMVAAVLLVAGVGSASAVPALPADSIATTATTGPATVLTAIGLAVLAPDLVVLANRLLRVCTLRDRGAESHLATLNLAAAPERMRPAVTFLTLLVGVSAGTLAMQGIEDRHVAADSTARVLASVNYLVVVLIGLFMAIALTNNLVAAIGRRRGEFAVLALIGSTGKQTRGVLLRETAAATATAVVVATIGAVVCVVPFAVVKTGSPAAAFAVGPLLLSAVLGAVVALLVTALAGWRAVRAVAVPA